MKKDYSKCAFVDAWMLPNNIRTAKENKDKYKDFSRDVFISYIDEDGTTKIDEFPPVYEYYTPINNFYNQKDSILFTLKNKPNYIDECNEKTKKNYKPGDPRYKMLYLGIDNVVCEKHVCKDYQQFERETHGYRVPKEYTVSQYDSKAKKRVTGTKTTEEYGSAIEHVLTNIRETNLKREAEGKYPYKVKWLTYEANHDVVFKTIIRNFSADSQKVVLKQPNLKVCFFDIEVDMRAGEEFPDPKKAQLAINAISMYNVWEDRNVTIALKPDRPFEDIAPMSLEEAKNMCKDIPDTTIVETEEELLKLMLDNFSKCDVMSGWNSDQFDIMYIVNRLKRKLGQNGANRLNMIDTDPVLITKTNKIGQKYQTYQLIGRIHLDYMNLYKHHNPKQQPSYKLDFIGKMETGMGKEEYEGNLEQLYHRDFRKFVEYNRQDVALLKAIDDKVKFIELTNALAHTHGVTFEAMTKTIGWVQQWEINNAHLKNRICPDRTLMKEDYERQQEKQRLIKEYQAGRLEYHPDSPHSPYFDWRDSGVPGAYVTMEHHGVAFNMASYDINSLYPSIIRAMNIGIEAIIGRVRQNYTAEYFKNKCITKKMYGKVKEKIPDYTKLWLHEWATQEMKMIWNKTEDMVTIDFEDGLTETRPAKEWNKIIFEDHAADWNISANGTIFDSVKQSITAWTMETGYTERKGFQKIMRMYDDCHDGADLTEEMENLLKGI